MGERQRKGGQVRSVRGTAKGNGMIGLRHAGSGRNLGKERKRLKTQQLAKIADLVGVEIEDLKAGQVLGALEALYRVS